MVWPMYTIDHQHKHVHRPRGGSGDLEEEGMEGAEGKGESSSTGTVVPGFRFYPTEEELVGFYLRNKLHDRRVRDIERVVPVVDVYAFHPCQLPQLSGEPCMQDSEQWFFFTPRKAKEAQGRKPTRLAPNGFWKATGSPRLVYSYDHRPMGMKKTMVFYEGKNPKGTKTKWKMNEYKALEDEGATSEDPKCRNEYSLCRVYVRSGCMSAFDRRPAACLQPRNQATDVGPSDRPMGKPSTDASLLVAQDDATPPGEDPNLKGNGPEEEMDWDTIGDLDWDVLGSI